jgi:hypothetical protein
LHKRSHKPTDTDARSKKPGVFVNTYIVLNFSASCKLLFFHTVIPNCIIAGLAPDKK